jgi:SnoaL-like domain
MEDPMNAETQRWSDKFELAELLAVLSSAVDRADRERIAACYAEDSFDDHGTFKGTGQQFAEFVSRPGPMSTMHHLLGQSVFEVEGDEARGETFYLFHGTVGTHVVAGHGRYLDHFRRIDGAWKLAYRRVVPDAVPAGDDPDAYWRASRDREDPSYDRLRRPPDDSNAVSSYRPPRL